MLAPTGLPAAAPQDFMGAPPLQWQTYDIAFKAPRLDAHHEVVSEPVLTVRHNGVLILNNVECHRPTGCAALKAVKREGQLLLQDHGDKVQFRNIWIVEGADSL